MKPTRGCIVDFGLLNDVDDELEIYPAIVTKVHNITFLDLTVFGIVGVGPILFRDISQAAVPSHRKWSWPVRDADDTKT